jgi:hypothetical protein
MESFQVNEKKEIRRKFKTCFDVVEFEDKNSKKFLNQNRSDNILLIRPFGNNFKINCFTRTSIREVLKIRREPPFLSKTCMDNQQFNQNTYYPLNIGDAECFFTKDELRKILDTNYSIYYVEPIINEQCKLKINCQGRINQVYKIKVCGGGKCLPKIFGPKENIPQDELYEEPGIELDLDDDELPPVVPILSRQ